MFYSAFFIYKYWGGVGGFTPGINNSYSPVLHTCFWFSFNRFMLSFKQIPLPILVFSGNRITDDEKNNNKYFHDQQSFELV